MLSVHGPPRTTTNYTQHQNDSHQRKGKKNGTRKKGRRKKKKETENHGGKRKKRKPDKGKRYIDHTQNTTNSDTLTHPHTQTLRSHTKATQRGKRKAH